MADVFLDLLSSWTPERAWWWGAFLGDGNCYVKDGTHRVSLVGATSTAARWRKLICPNEDTPPRVLGNTDKAVESVIYSKALAERLAQLGVRGSKTFNLPWPDDLPAELLPHFLRGLWDTDGHVYVSDVRRRGKSGGFREVVLGYTSACQPFLTLISHALAQIAGTHPAIVKNQKGPHVFYAIHYATGTAYKVADFLYKDAPEHLRNEDRWGKYQELLAYRAERETPCACGKPHFSGGKCKGCFWAAQPHTTGEGTVCSTPACGKPVSHNGLCSACATKLRRAQPGWERKSTGLCGCGKPAYRKGMCDACYSKVRRAEQAAARAGR